MTQLKLFSITWMWDTSAGSGKLAATPPPTPLSVCLFLYFFSPNPDAEIMRRKIEQQRQHSDWLPWKSVSNKRRRPPWRPGLHFLSRMYSLEVSCDKTQKVALSLLSSRYTPYPELFFLSPLSLLLPLLLVVWLSALSAHSLAPALMFLISLI